MTTPTKKPPRFVPTLTDVVQMPEAEGSSARPSPPVTRPATTAASLSVPLPAAPHSPPPLAAPAPVAPLPAGLPYGFEEYVVHRVMQRVDVVLDQRLREAIAVVVQEQTRSMVPRLREEVESVVRQAVYEAVAEELAGERSGH
ncbi:MAG: hypothetical protein WA955_02040 [Diaphorobacter nitroreducens]|jgi:hypothetical protein|uniref:hypothetical protein n=1 Tax=Diaphorobacter TaxID=238749 RepID=UPI0010740561|nr:MULTISPECIES: hypothetical protein [Diaphorobacter]QPN31235.1 hypothetical protein I3K84_00805 [Diaphorobacter sp. JS3051]TFI48126.1 hypothetical protein E4O93_09295 [Diaphorobacter sp. DS2]UOB03827.1 hypothetical protein MRB47_10140 [Diaphorobacter sp. LI3]